jgi:hypothetical protein
MTGGHKKNSAVVFANVELSQMITSKKLSICHRERAERFRMYVSIAKGTDTREMYSRLMAQPYGPRDRFGGVAGAAGTRECQPTIVSAHRGRRGSSDRRGEIALTP